MSATVANVTVTCQNQDCCDTEDFDLDGSNLDTSVASLAEQSGWGYHFGAGMRGTFLCPDCLDNAEKAEAS